MRPFTTVILILVVSANIVAAVSLENASVSPIGVAGNDMVFDSTRNVFYMSVPSSDGFPYGNSIVTIDPASGTIVHTTFVGSEPDKLAISADGSRVYVGVNGADSFSWWEPATDTVGPLVNFTIVFGFGPYNVTDFAIDPNDPHTVVVSKDDVSSTAAGDLELFRDDVSLQEMRLVYGAESICFSDATNLIGYNSFTSGFDLWKWALDQTNLTETQHVLGVIAGAVKIKSVDGLIFSNIGKVVSAASFSALGTFSGLPTSSVVEPIPGTNTVYFLGGSSSGGGHLQLMSFDRKTFLPFDSKTFTNATSSSVRSLLRAGKNAAGTERLGYIQFDGNAGLITLNPPLLEIITFQSNGSLSRLAWPSDIGRQYQVKRSPDLRIWTTFITTNAVQFRTAVSFGPLGTAGREFYRVVAN